MPYKKAVLSQKITQLLYGCSVYVVTLLTNDSFKEGMRGTGSLIAMPSVTSLIALAKSSASSIVRKAGANVPTSW
jgi:hypothetical protein